MVDYIQLLPEEMFNHLAVGTSDSQSASISAVSWVTLERRKVQRLEQVLFAAWSHHSAPLANFSLPRTNSSATSQFFEAEQR